MKRIFYILLGLFITFYGFAIVCILNPGISEAVGRFLYHDADSGQRQSAEVIPEEKEFGVKNLDIEMFETSGQNSGGRI